MWQEACEQGGILSFKIVSGSMRPIIKTGDVVKVTRTEPSTVCIGDIIAFQDGQHVVVHRVIGKSYSNQQIIFHHRGDAGVSSGYVTAQNLIGRVTTIERKGHATIFESLRYSTINCILVWQLRLADRLRRTKHRCIGIGLRSILRPAWRPCRSLLIRH